MTSGLDNTNEINTEEHDSYYEDLPTITGDVDDFTDGTNISSG